MRNTTKSLLPMKDKDSALKGSRISRSWPSFDVLLLSLSTFSSCPFRRFDLFSSRIIPVIATEAGGQSPPSLSSTVRVLSAIRSCRISLTSGCKGRRLERKREVGYVRKYGCVLLPNRVCCPYHLAICSNCYREIGPPNRKRNGTKSEREM